MFDSIIFDLSLYFRATARCVHFTVPSGTRGALFFLWEQMYTSGSTFIKKIKPFVCHYISMPWQYIKNKTARQIASSLVLLM